MAPSIHKFKTKEWSHNSASFIQDYIDKTLALQGSCSVMLTGGRTASNLYEAWAKIPRFHATKNVNFYFGDERCVSPKNIESNYNMVMKTLFIGGVPSGCSVTRVEAEGPDPEVVAKSYNDVLPNDIDILILTAGEDGHVASIFPGHGPFPDEGHKKVMSVRAPDLKIDRISITPYTVLNAKQVFLLATGFEKIQPLKKALYSPLNMRLLPIQLTLKGAWLLDESAAGQI